MKKITCVFTVLLSFIALMIGYFAIDYHNQVIADETPTFYFSESGSRFLFTNSDLDINDGESLLVHFYDRNNINTAYHVLVYFNYDSDSSSFIFSGYKKWFFTHSSSSTSDYNYILTALSDTTNFTDFSYNICGSSFYDYTDFSSIERDFTSANFSPLSELFDDNSGMELILDNTKGVVGDLSNILSLHGISKNRITVDNHNSYFEDENLIINNCVLGDNSFTIRFKDAYDNLVYSWEPSVNIEPSVTGAKFDGVSVDGKVLEINNGIHSFSFTADPQFAINESAVRFSIVDISNNTVLVNQCSMSKSGNQFSVSFELKNIAVNHKLSYVVDFNDSCKFIDGVQVSDTPQNTTNSFIVRANHAIEKIKFSSDNKNNPSVLKSGDDFKITISSKEKIKSILSNIESKSCQNVTPEKSDEIESQNTWYDVDGVISYEGTATTDKLRYLDFNFSITYSDDSVDIYDANSFAKDKLLSVYPNELELSVRSYVSVLKDKTLNEKSSFQVTLSCESSKSDLFPTLKIKGFSGTDSTGTGVVINNDKFASSVNGDTVTIDLSDIASICTDDSYIKFEMILSDAVGNETYVVIDPQAIFYGNLKISNLQFSTSNSNTYITKSEVYHYVTINDSLTLNFNCNHNLSGYSIEFTNGAALLVDSKGSATVAPDHNGIITIDIDCAMFESGKLISFSEISFTDTSGKTTILDDSIIEQINASNIIYLSEFEVAYNENDFVTRQYLSSSDSINVELMADDVVDTKREVQITAIKLLCNGTSGKTNIVDLFDDTIDSGFSSTKNKTIPMSIYLNDSKLDPDFNYDDLDLKMLVTLEDRAGNVAEVTFKNPINFNCVYYKEISKSISDFKIETPYSKKNIKINDKLDITFRSSHPLSKCDDNDKYELSGTINSLPVIFTSDDGKEWSATFTVPEDNTWTDNGDIVLSLDLFDMSSNEHYELTNTESNELVYYSPISISELSFTSTNNNTSISLANIYDDVTLSFVSTHKLIVDNANIADKNVSFSMQELDGIFAYSVTCKVKDLNIADNTLISYIFMLTDSADNTPMVVINSSQNPNILYMAPILVYNQSIESNNDNGNLLAKNGNYIQVSFETTHPVNIDSAYIADQELSLVSTDNDRMHWHGSYQVQNGIVPDTTNIPIKIVVGDDAGNDPYNIISSEIAYYAPISVSSTIITTSNSNDSTKYAIDDNTVTVSFVVNHQIKTSSSSFTLAGSSGLATEEEGLSDGSYKYSFSKKISNGELADQSQIAFNYSITDIVGNDAVVVNENSSITTNNITYYSPLTVTTSIESNGSNSRYAKNGDTITIKANANHAFQIKSATVSEKTMSVSGNGSDKITMSYAIPSNEDSLKEGTVSPSLSFSDVAGNTFSTDKVDSGSVIYDRSTPSVNVKNAFSGFSATDISFDINITDANIDKTKTNVKVNDHVYTIGDGIEENGNSYYINVKNKTEGNLSVTVTVVDLAGNTSDPVTYNVTVDKTNPEVTTTTLYTSSNKIFKPGIVIADLFEIEEVNMSEISCTISDGSSIQDWDINAPLDTDGKITVSIIAVDKAGNSSEQLIFDVIIDGTAPSPVLKDTITNSILTVGKNTFDKSASVVFGLQALSYDSSKPDKYTTLTITCPDGTTIDLIAQNSVNSTGDYYYDFNKTGSYVVTIEAVDELGNSTGEVQYVVNISNNSRLIIIGACVLGGLALIGGAVLVIRKKIR